MTPFYHYQLKDRATILNEYTSYSTTNSGEIQVYSLDVPKGEIIYMTDVFISTTVDVSFRITKYTSYGETTLWFGRISAGANLKYSPTTPFEFIGSSSMQMRIYITFPSGGGEVEISWQGWKELLLWREGSYDLSKYEECLYG